MQNMKIRVTPETSPIVQQLLFDMGCTWGDGKYVQFEEHPFLYVNKQGFLTFSGKEDAIWFDICVSPELKLKFSLVPLHAKITILGKQYNAEDVVKALAGVKEAV